MKSKKGAFHIVLKAIQKDLSVCKLKDASQIHLDGECCFAAIADGEISLVCEAGLVPKDAVAVEGPWRALKIKGPLDFSLVGILAKILAVLAAAKISVFAVSTYDTDYILVKSENIDPAIQVLLSAGYKIEK